MLDELVQVPAAKPVVILAASMIGPANFDPDQHSLDSGLSFSGTESLAQQSFAEEADINVLVRRFGLTGEMPVAREPAQYGDFSQVTDFHTAMLAVRAAEETFLELPAELRGRFENDPGQLIDFVLDPANKAEAVKLGLLPQDSSPVAEVPPEPPPPAPPAGGA